MPGEFESVSKRIQSQLAKPVKEPDVSLMSKILQEKDLLEKKVAEFDKNRRGFRVPKGTAILLFRRLRYGRQMMIDGRDFEPIISSKDVAYDIEDVCLNPTTGECTMDRLRESVYFQEKNYFGFFLPKNDKGIPFILVPRYKVQIQGESEDDLMQHAAEIRRSYNEHKFTNINENPKYWASQIFGDDGND